MVNYAAKSLIKEKLRFIIGLSGISVAIALILIINGFSSGLYKQTAAYYENLQADYIISESSTGMLTATSSLPRSIDSKIKKIEGVESVYSTIYVPYILRGNVSTPIIIIGYTPGKSGGPWNIIDGRNILKKNEIVLDVALARQRNKKVGNMIEIFSKKLNIVGLSTETTSYMSSYAFVTINHLRELTKNYFYTSYFLIDISDNKQNKDIKEEITKGIDVGTVSTPSQISDKEVDLVKELMSSPINVITFIALVIGIMVVGLSIYTSTLSKVNELGIIKAVGASNRFLYLVVLKQSFISTTLAMIFGLGIAFTVQNFIPLIAPQFTVYIDSNSIFKTLVSVLLMAFIAALLPIRKIAGIDPALVFKG